MICWLGGWVSGWVVSNVCTYLSRYLYNSELCRAVLYKITEDLGMMMMMKSGLFCLKALFLFPLLFSFFSWFVL